MPTRAPRRKPKGKAKQKSAPKPVVVDPDIDRFPTIASMHAVKVQYSESTLANGGGSNTPLDSFPRQGEKLTEDRKARAANIDSNQNRGQAVAVEEERLQSKLMQTNLFHWTRHGLGVLTFARVSYGEDISTYPILPDPTKPHSPNAIPQPHPPLHETRKK